LDALAFGNTTPGGGSAAAYSAAMAASLIAMVGRVTIGKKKYAEVEGDMLQLVDDALSLQANMRIAVKKDADAFESYMQAMRLPKDTDQEKAERIRAIQAASIKAACVPLQVGREALEIIQLALRAAEKGNVNAISDAASAAALANAALEGAGLNVRINLLGIEKEAEPAQMLNELKLLEKQAAKVKETMRVVLNERGGFNLS